MPAARGRPARVGRLLPVSPTLRPRVRPRAWRLEWSGGAASTGGLPAPGVFTVPNSARAASPAAKGVFPRQSVQTVSCHPDLANQTASASADAISVCNSNAAAAAAAWSVRHRPHLHTADRLTSPHLPVPQPLVALDEGLCAFRHRRRATQLPAQSRRAPLEPEASLEPEAEAPGPVNQAHSPQPTHPHEAACAFSAPIPSPPQHPLRELFTPPRQPPPRATTPRRFGRGVVCLPASPPSNTTPPPSSCASCPSMFPSSFLFLPPVLWSSA
jgi:hypothetical protein